MPTMTDEKLKALRDGFSDVLGEHDVDAEEAVTLLLMFAAGIYAQIGSEPAGFASTAKVALERTLEKMASGEAQPAIEMADVFEEAAESMPDEEANTIAAELFKATQDIVRLVMERHRNASPATMLSVAAAFAKRSRLNLNDFMVGARAAYDFVDVEIVSPPS